MEQNFNCRKLYIARTAKKMSRREVAEIINVNQQTISDYESGKSQPKLGRIKELTKAVGVKPEEICYNLHKKRLIAKKDPLFIAIKFYKKFYKKFYNKFKKLS